MIFLRPRLRKPARAGVLLVLRLLLVCAPFAAGAQTITNLTYHFTDYTQRPLNVQSVIFTPLGPADDYNGALLSLIPIVHTRASQPGITNGLDTFTNVISGYWYSVSFTITAPGANYITTQTNFFPYSTNGYATVNGVNFLAFPVGGAPGQRGVRAAFLYPTNLTTVISNTLTYLLPSFGSNFNGGTFNYLALSNTPDLSVFQSTNQAGTNIIFRTDIAARVLQADFNGATNGLNGNALAREQAEAVSATNYANQVTNDLATSMSMALSLRASGLTNLIAANTNIAEFAHFAYKPLNGGNLPKFYYMIDSFGNFSGQNLSPAGSLQQTNIQTDWYGFTNGNVAFPINGSAIPDLISGTNVVALAASALAQAKAVSATNYANQVTNGLNFATHPEVINATNGLSIALNNAQTNSTVLTSNALVTLIATGGSTNPTNNLQTAVTGQISAATNDAATVTIARIAAATNHLNFATHDEVVSTGTVLFAWARIAFPPTNQWSDTNDAFRAEIKDAKTNSSATTVAGNALTQITNIIQNNPNTTLASSSTVTNFTIVGTSGNWPVRIYDDIPGNSGTWALQPLRGNWRIGWDGAGGSGFWQSGDTVFGVLSGGTFEGQNIFAFTTNGILEARQAYLDFARIQDAQISNLNVYASANIGGTLNVGTLNATNGGGVSTATFNSATNVIMLAASAQTTAATNDFLHAVSVSFTVTNLFVGAIRVLTVTNTVISSRGAGSTDMNRSFFGGPILFTNVDGGSYSNNGSAFIARGIDNTLLYSLPAIPGTNGSLIGGSFPIPSVQFGFNQHLNGDRLEGSLLESSSNLLAVVRDIYTAIAFVQTNALATNISSVGLSQTTNIVSGNDNNTLYVAAWGNDSTAQRGNKNRPWKNIYDFSGSVRGALGNATNGDTVVLLTDIVDPVIPFLQPNITLDLGSHQIMRTNKTDSIAVWPSGGRGDFNFPFVFMNDNCTIKNGTLYHDTGLSYGVGGTSVDFGMQLPSIFAADFFTGTNIDQILANSLVNDNVNATNFGRWASFGITNNGATNFVVDSVYMNQHSYDICFVDNYIVECSDTDGGGDFLVQLFKPSKITFKNCSAFTYWDAWIFKGLGTTATFINQNTIVGFFYNQSSLVSASFCGGESSIITVLGGSLLQYNFTNNVSLVTAIAGTRPPTGSGDINSASVLINGLNFLGYATNFFETRSFGGTSPDTSVSGWYLNTNGFPKTLNNFSGNFSGNGAGLTNLNPNAAFSSGVVTLLGSNVVVNLSNASPATLSLSLSTNANGSIWASLSNSAPSINQTNTLGTAAFQPISAFATSSSLSAVTNNGNIVFTNSPFDMKYLVGLTLSGRSALATNSIYFGDTGMTNEVFAGNARNSYSYGLDGVLRFFNTFQAQTIQTSGNYNNQGGTINFGTSGSTALVQANGGHTYTFTAVGGASLVSSNANFATEFSPTNTAPMVATQISSTTTITNTAGRGMWFFSLVFTDAVTGQPSATIRRPGLWTNTVSPAFTSVAGVATNFYSLPVNPGTTNSVTDTSGTGASTAVIDSHLEQ